MNNDILNRILSDNEELDRFLNWLSSQKNEVGDDGCTKIDFVIFFLSYLRSQTASFFEQKRTKTKSDWKRVTPVTDKPATNVKPLSSGDTVRRLFSPENGNNGILVSPIKQRLNNIDNHQNNRVTPKKLFNPQTGIYDHNYPPIHQFNTANSSMNQSNTTNLSMNQSNTTNSSMSQLHSNSPIHQSNTANSSMNQPTTTNLSMNQSTTTNLSMNQSTTTNLSMNQSNPSTLSMSQLHSYAPIQPSSTANPSMNQIPIHQSKTANLSMNFAVGSSNFQMNPISVLPTQIQGGVMMQGGGRMISPNIQIDPRSLQGVALVMSPSKQAGPWNNMQGGCRVMAPTILVDPRSNNVHVVGQVMSPINQAGPWGNVGPVMSSPIKADPKSNLVVGQVTTSNQAGPWGIAGPVMSSPIKTDPKSNLVVGQVTTGNQAGPWGKVGSVMSPATPSDPKSNLVGRVTSPNNQAGPWGNTGSPTPKIDLQDTRKVIISDQAGPWGNVMNPSTTSDPKSNLVVGQVSSPSNKTGPWCNIGSPPTASETKINLQNAAQVTSPTHQTSGPWKVVTPPNQGVQTKNSNTQGVSQMTYHTPQRTNFSHRANSLLFSPNSSSSSAGVLSPDSPSQQRDWRKSEGGRRGGGGGGAPTLKNMCIGDFIVAGSVGKKQDKARKRIKPTRLAMAGDSQTNDVSSVSKSSSNVFTTVPESPSADTNQSNNASNFDEERQLLKQYNKQKEGRDKSPTKKKKETTNSNEETVKKIELKKKKEMIDKGEELEEEGKEENKSEEVPKEERKKENISEKKREEGGKEKDRSREKPKEDGKKENGSEEKPKEEGKKGNWSKEKPKEGDKEEDRSEEKPKEEEKKKNRSEEKPEEGKGEEKFEDRSEKGSESKSKELKTKEVDKEKCDDKNRIEKRSASICKSSSKEVKPKEGKEECNYKDKVREEIASEKENARSDSKNRGKEESVNAKSDGKNKAIEEEIEKGETKITVPNDPKYIRADPSKVTNAPMLRKLAKIYCVLLDCNLVFNVTAEIHFLVSLLAVKVADRRTDKPEEKAKCDGKSSVVGGIVECDGKSAGTEQNFKCDEKSVTVKDVKCDGKSVTVKDVECDKKSVTEKDVECDEHSVTEQNIDLVIQEKLVGVEKLETSLSSPSPPPPSSTSYPPPPASDTNKEEENVDELLSSVHNSVYFAYYVLERQMKYLQLLDRRTLKFLAESKKIAQFQRSFRNKLLKLCSAQPSKTTTNPPATCATDPESGICPVQFHVETDNRWTFTCDSSFATYRKQRDELYAILQAWARGQQGGEGGGGFGKLKTRVERLLAMSQDPINVRHLAKHFCDLLLRAVATSEETTIEELENLPEVNKSKLSLLTKRLTEPSSEKVSSPRPETNFPGFQQFYHDFLVIASQNFLFNVHLINCFVNEITVRSSATYDIDESEGEGQVVQEETRQMFVQGLSSLCVLAKFLGLVVFAPYRSSFEISKSVLQEEINIRKQLDPPLKLDAYLDRASRTGSLVYTVPWVVEYLGMMDAVACHLPCYQQVLVTLFNIYRLCSPRLESADNADKREVEREGSRETEGSVEREGLKETLGNGDEEKLMKLKEGGAMEKIGIVETVKDVDKEKVIILKERGKLEKQESNHNQENKSGSFKDSKELEDKDSKEKNSGSKDGNQELKLVEEDGNQGNSELKNGIVGLKDSIKGVNNVIEVKKSVLEDVTLDECLTDDEKCDRKQDKSVSKDVSSVSVDSKSVSIDGSSVSNDVNSVSKDVSLVSKDVNSVLKDVNSVSRDANSVSRDASSVSNDMNSLSKDASSVSNDVNSVSNEKSSASKAVNSVSREASSVSKDVNSVSIATKPFSYDTKPNSKDTLDNELFLNARTESESVSKELTDSSKFLCKAELLKSMLLFDDTRDRVQPAEMAPLVGALLRLCLGWLFGSAILTQELMGQVVMRSDVERFLAETFQTTRNKLTMDSCSDLVTHEIIHKFCPYLKSFHALLTKKTTQIAVASVKHVTPISSVSTLIQTATNNTTAVPPEIAIQLQLEDHFFMGQSESVKRTVEFVAERIASACIKEVIGTVVVDLKKKVADTLQHQSAQSKKTGTTVDLKPLVAEYRRRVTEQLSQVEQSRLGVALRALLGPDICRQSLELCQLITARKFQERVVNWLQAHINIQEILTKVITTYEKEHKSNSNNDEDDALEDFFKADKLEPTKIGEEDSSSKTFNVDEVTVCSRTLIHIQDIASDALESFGKQGIKSATEALELVSDVEKSLKMCPCQPIKKQICIALLDYVILMISFQPDQVSDEMLAQLSRLLYNGGHLEVEHLWSQRNVMLLIQGGAGEGGSSRSRSNTSAAWRRFSQLTVALVEARCMDVASLEQQVVALFRCAWPDNVLKTISEGIRCTVNDLKKKTRCDPEFLDLLSDIAVDISDDIEFD